MVHFLTLNKSKVNKYFRLKLRGSKNLVTRDDDLYKTALINKQKQTHFIVIFSNESIAAKKILNYNKRIQQIVFYFSSLKVANIY